MGWGGGIFSPYHFHSVCTFGLMGGFVLVEGPLIFSFFSFFLLYLQFHETEADVCSEMKCVMNRVTLVLVTGFLGKVKDLKSS